MYLGRKRSDLHSSQELGCRYPLDFCDVTMMCTVLLVEVASSALSSYFRLKSTFDCEFFPLGDLPWSSARLSVLHVKIYLLNWIQKSMWTWWWLLQEPLTEVNWILNWQSWSILYTIFFVPLKAPTTNIFCSFLFYNSMRGQTFFAISSFTIAWEVIDHRKWAFVASL